jgi:hypothetical protein
MEIYIGIVWAAICVALISYGLVLNTVFQHIVRCFGG